MRRFRYHTSENTIVTVTEEEILNTCKNLMHDAMKQKRYIDDWITSHWAWEVNDEQI